jgi:hypothetical protein
MLYSAWECLKGLFAQVFNCENFLSSGWHGSRHQLELECVSFLLFELAAVISFFVARQFETHRSIKHNDELMIAQRWRPIVIVPLEEKGNCKLLFDKLFYKMGHTKHTSQSVFQTTRTSLTNCSVSLCWCKSEFSPDESSSHFSSFLLSCAAVQSSPFLAIGYKPMPGRPLNRNYGS